MERHTVLTPKDLETLIQPGRGPRVSIYLPARPLHEAAQDAIRLKNLLKQAHEGLAFSGLRRAEAEYVLSELRGLLDDTRFWRSDGAGVALFASMRESRAYRLPEHFEELVVVGDAYHVKPLLGLLTGEGRYSLLALSQSRIRLLQGDRWSASDVTPSTIPTSLEEALLFDVFEKQTQVHTAGPPRGAGASRTSQFHGHGSTERDDKGDVLRFFRLVDTGIRGRLLKGGGPLVLAGVDYLRSLYREANTYPDLMVEGISGNPDGMSAAQLHARAREILMPRFESHRDRLSDRIASRLGTRHVASDLREVLAAARFGRVDTLFVAADDHRWGRFDPGTGELELRDSSIPGTEDLLDRATVETLARRGRVYAVPMEDIPGSTPAAALLRY